MPSDLPSSDPATAAERIAYRRELATARLMQAKSKQVNGQPVQGDEAQTYTGKQRYLESAALLELQCEDAWDKVTGIQMCFRSQEGQHRIQEENDRLDRYEALQIEAVTSGQKTAAIEMRWSELMNTDTPQELYEQLQRQKNACQHITESKDRRIADLRMDLKAKDEDYQQLLKLQRGDICSLIHNLREDYNLLKLGHEQQLQQIEHSYEQDRAEMRSKHKAEVDSVFDKQGASDESNFLCLQVRHQGLQREMQELHLANYTSSKQQKYELEMALQEIEQHLAKMECVYFLNTDKLDYNYIVLLERGIEQRSMHFKYKHRIMQLRDTLSASKDRHDSSNNSYKSENQQLTDDFTRLTRDIKKLEKQVQQFERSDEERFREVWQANESKARALLAQVLQADKIIHEQLLGTEWQAPSEEDLRLEFDVLSGSGRATSRSNGESTGASSAACQFSAAKTKKVLDMIAAESCFLLEDSVLEQIRAMPPDQGDVLRVEALLRYLGITGQADLNLLVQNFYQGQDVDDEALMIDPADVLEIVKGFFREKEDLEIANVVPDKRKKRERRTHVSNESQADKKTRKRKEERQFWERLAHVLPSMKFRVWKALQAHLGRYYSLLQKRSQVIENVVQLQRQSEQLKLMLDSYLGSAASSALRVPASHVLTMV